MPVNQLTVTHVEKVPAHGMAPIKAVSYPVFCSSIDISTWSARADR
jgi:hypothetical protein